MCPGRGLQASRWARDRMPQSEGGREAVGKDLSWKVRAGGRPDTFTDCVMMDKFPRLGFIICTVPTGFNQA